MRRCCEEPSRGLVRALIIKLNLLSLLNFSYTKDKNFSGKPNGIFANENISTDGYVLQQ